MRIFTPGTLATLLLALLATAPVFATSSGPTPYPNPRRPHEWPGRGPVLFYPWLEQSRNRFWLQREQDRGAVVFAGDSLTGNWKTLAESFPGLKVANRGIGADGSRGLLFRFKEDVLDLNPRAIVLCIGTNDLSAKATPAQVEANLIRMLDLVRASLPATPVFLCTLPPRDHAKYRVRPEVMADLNARIRRIATGRGQLVLIDLSRALADEQGGLVDDYFLPDRLHLSTKGYQVWAQLLGPRLLRRDAE